MFNNIYVHELVPTEYNGIGINGDAASSNISVLNSVFWRVEGQAIWIKGDGWIVRNNNISHGSVLNWLNGTDATGDTDAIRFFGINHIIQYNHIHDFLKPAEQGGRNPHIDAFQTYSNYSSPLDTYNVLIDGNYIDGGDQGVFATDDSEMNGIGDSLHHIYITNNVFKDTDSIQLSLGDAANSVIANNTFIGGTTLQMRLRAMGTYGVGCDSTVVKNNIFYSDYYGSQPDEDSGDDIVFDYNIHNIDFSWPEQLDGYNEYSLFGVDPQFTDPDNGDFTLQADSPAIGFADSALVAYLVDKDIEETERTWTDGESDAGAYLYGTPPEYDLNPVEELVQTGASTTTIKVSWPDTLANESYFRIKDIEGSTLATVSANDTTATITVGLDYDEWVVILAGYVNGESAPTDSINATTEAQVVTTITISPATASMQVGTTFTPSATVYDQDGGTMEGETVTWTSDNTGVADVDESTGVITAVASGLATITAAVGEVEGTATVTVYEGSAYNGQNGYDSGAYDGQKGYDY